MIRLQVISICYLVSLANACYAANAPSPARLGTLVDGDVFRACLVDWNEDGQFLFDLSNERRTVRPSDLVAWGAYADRDRGTQIVLAEGGLLVADLRAIESDGIVVAGRLWTEMRLPRGMVRAVVFRPPADSLTRDRLVERAETQWRGEDQLLLENGDQLTGQLDGRVGPEPGALNPTKVNWLLRDRRRSVEVPLGRVVALLFASESSEPAVMRSETLVGFGDGSWLRAEKLGRKNRGLEVVLPGGFSMLTEPMSTTSANPWESVVLLQPITTRVTYLSELQPLGYRHDAFLEVNWPFFDDRSVSGGRLRHGGHVFLKGLGMHSSARLAYELNGRYRWLQAELAIDQLAGRQGSVSFRVYVQNDQGEWSEAYESGMVRGAQELVPLRLEIQGAKAMALIVDFAERADQWDHAMWLNARLIATDDGRP